MITRLDIAKARARVALARRSGIVLPEEIRSLAAMEFSEAPRIRKAWNHFADVPGVYAGGRDFGAPEPTPDRHLPARTSESDAVLVEAGVFTPDVLSSLNARVARGELERSIQRTRRQAIDASLTQFALAKRLGIGLAKLRWMLSVGDLFAFVADDELRFPAWQFTDDPAHPVLPHLSRLVEAFGDGLQPASILGFMTTPHGVTRIEGQVATPIEWLEAGGDVEDLVTMLDGLLT